MKYWLLKSEESCYSIDNLKTDKKTAWSGVRNYQARNFMKDMSVGDLCLFYHSNSKPTGVAGVCKVVASAHTDETALDPQDEHYDSKSTKEKPIWECVDVGFVKKFKDVITLQDIKLDPKLAGMALVQKGSRLSVQPVGKEHFEHIVDVLSKN